MTWNHRSLVLANVVQYLAYNISERSILRVITPPLTSRSSTFFLYYWSSFPPNKSGELIFNLGFDFSFVSLTAGSTRRRNWADMHRVQCNARQERPNKSTGLAARRR